MSRRSTLVFIGACIKILHMPHWRKTSWKAKGKTEQRFNVCWCFLQISITTSMNWKISNAKIDWKNFKRVNHRSLKEDNLWGKINRLCDWRHCKERIFEVFSSLYWLNDFLLFYKLLQLGTKHWTSNYQTVSWYFMYVTSQSILVS